MGVEEGNDEDGKDNGNGDGNAGYRRNKNVKNLGWGEACHALGSGVEH